VPPTLPAIAKRKKPPAHTKVFLSIAKRRTMMMLCGSGIKIETRKKRKRIRREKTKKELEKKRKKSTLQIL
jgi:hypothetical protein